MKKILLFVLLPLIFIYCDNDIYDGSKRYVIEGDIIQNDLPLVNQEVSIYLIKENMFDNFPNDYFSIPISEIEIPYEVKFLSKVLTDKNGHFLLGVPGLPNSTKKNAYCIRVNDTNFGFISENHFKDYYLNLTSLIVE